MTSVPELWLLWGVTNSFITRVASWRRRRPRLPQLALSHEFPVFSADDEGSGGG
jgi:DNA-directed RNA polymerase specialized sigma24 family protein